MAHAGFKSNMETNTRLKIFVFGSNLRGVHGASSAKHARFHYGAKLGVGRGRTGNAYAIPTKDKNLKVLSIDEIKYYVDEFIEYAISHPELDFQIVKIGCGLAGFSNYEIAPLFKGSPSNCIFHEDWLPYIK